MEGSPSNRHLWLWRCMPMNVSLYGTLSPDCFSLWTHYLPHASLSVTCRRVSAHQYENSWILPQTWRIPQMASSLRQKELCCPPPPNPTELPMIYCSSQVIFHAKLNQVTSDSESMKPGIRFTACQCFIRKGARKSKLRHLSIGQTFSKTHFKP